MLLTAYCNGMSICAGLLKIRYDIDIIQSILFPSFVFVDVHVFIYIMYNGNEGEAFLQF